MRALPVLGLALLCAACAGTPPPPPPPDPVPPVAAPETPGIETAAVQTVTLPAVPLTPGGAPAPAGPAAQVALPPSLSRAQIDRTFTHHRRFFNDAYRERRQARPRLSGTIQVSFTIQPDGTARGVRQHSSTLDDAEFERKVLEQVGRMSFPPAAGPTPVERYPLQFTEQNKR